METKELRELLAKRLYLELQLFKDSRLVQEKNDIFRSSYEIEIYVNLYDILTAHIDNLPKDVIRRLLHLRFGILEALYREWLTKEDGFYDELRSYVCSELETILELGGTKYEEEDTDGTGTDQTAQGK